MSATNISPGELHGLSGDGRSVDLVDVRTPLEFREVHVGFARNVPLDTLNPTEVMLGRRAAGDQPLYVICRGGGRASQACEKFIAAGYPNVVNVEGGTLAWIAAGLPVARGKKAISLERQVRIAAGFLVLLGVGLGWVAYSAFFLLSAFVGAGLIYAGVTGRCGMGLLLAHMPWNRGEHGTSGCDCAS